MQYMILVLFALFFSTGSYFCLAALLKVPTLKVSRAILAVGKKEKKQAAGADAFLLDLAVKLGKHLPMGEYQRRKLSTSLQSADIPMTPETYRMLSYIKAGFFFLGVIPALFIFPLLAPAFVILGIGVYYTESGRAEKLVKKKRDEIEYELPRFAATLEQELQASRDVLSMLENYQKNAGPAMKNELTITTADMRTGNYEAALTRMEARVSSAMLSDVIRGLIGCIRGDDGVAYFRMLAHDMKQLEIQRLKKLALERPPKIRRYSFLLLACMLLLYLGVMGYQILGTMAEIF